MLVRRLVAHSPEEGPRWLRGRAARTGSAWRGALALVLAGLSSAVAAQDQQAFAAALQAAQTAADRGNYKAARTQLVALLAQHAQRDYVRVKRAEIEALHKTCAFRIEHPPPHPRTLVEGELLSCDLTTGALKIRYKAGQVRDFTKEGNGLLWHKARFAGAHTIEWKGRSYPAVGTAQEAGPIACVCANEQGTHRVLFGLAPQTQGRVERWVPSRIDHLTENKDTKLVEKETTPCRPGKPFVLGVRVTDSSVVALYNHQPVLTGKRLGPEFGSFGFAGIPYQELTIEGKAEPAWLQGLVDEALHGKLAAFEKTYDPRKELPAWLFASVATAAEPTASMPAGSLADYPDFGFDEVQVANVRRAQDLLAKDELERARAFLDQCDGERLPAATRSVLFAALCVRQRRFAEGLQHCAAVLAAAPGSMMAGALRAQCLRGLGRDEEALAQWQELLVRAPQEVAFHVGAAWAHLGLGRLDAAKAVIEAALARGLGDAELDTVNAMLVKAQKGPDWPRTFVHRSVHFEVASDIDLTVCREAATLLEQSFASYVDRLTPVADAAKRFRVFLFSGEAGYKRYVDDVVGGDLPIHTAGLYSPVLEQLLIWNLPDRDAMMRTVRHEGFHQYLDRVMRDAPRWLNEGLAEYHETARYQHNGWKLGQVRADHVRSLKVLRGPAPLASFLDVDPSAFYAKAQLHYAQSWAFVHFLLHSTPANEKRFRALWDRLIGGASAADAIAAVFPAAGIAPLETEFRAHVGALAKQ